MIPTLGLLIATYCVARLIQVPIQDARVTHQDASIALIVISVLAIVVIGFLAISLALSGASSTP